MPTYASQGGQEIPSLSSRFLSEMYESLFRREFVTQASGECENGLVFVHEHGNFGISRSMLLTNNSPLVKKRTVLG